MTMLPPPADPARVLIVDDEPDLVEPLRYCLEQEGYEVQSAGNGFEALGIVRAWQPRVILLDVMMPGENGYRVSRFIKEDVAAGRLPPTAIILVTARRLAEPEREATFATFSGCDDVIYKPFELDDILETVRRHACDVPAPVR